MRVSVLDQNSCKRQNGPLLCRLSLIRVMDKISKALVLHLLIKSSYRLWDHCMQRACFAISIATSNAFTYNRFTLRTYSFGVIEFLGILKLQYFF